MNAIASISPARELDDELDRLRVLGGRRVHIRRDAIGVDAAPPQVLDEPHVLIGRVELDGDAPVRQLDLHERLDHAVCRRLRGLEFGLEIEPAQRARGFGPRVSLRVRRSAAMKSASMPDAARAGQQPFDAFAGIEHDQVVGGVASRRSSQATTGCCLRRVTDADERAAEHRGAAALEEAREHVELASLGDRDVRPASAVESSPADA